MTTRNRPLSPHLQVYKPQITSILSITHRITGVVLCFGAVLLTYWLMAATYGPDAFATAQAILGSWLGILVLFGVVFSLWYHLPTASGIWLGMPVGLRTDQLHQGMRCCCLCRAHLRHIHLAYCGGGLIMEMRSQLGRVRGLGFQQRRRASFLGSACQRIALVPLVSVVRVCRDHVVGADLATLRPGSARITIRLLFCADPDMFSSCAAGPSGHHRGLHAWRGGQADLDDRYEIRRSYLLAVVPCLPLSA